MSMKYVSVIPKWCTKSRQPLVWASAAIAVVSLAVAAFALWGRPAAVTQTSARLTIALPAGAELTSYPAITADGRTVGYVVQQGTEDSQLYLRDLDSFEARAVAGATGARQPFFSPDGRWVAFFAQGQLQKAEVKGGAPVRLVEAPYPFGGAWTGHGRIIYAASLSSGLLQIPASGGTAISITRPDGAVSGYAHVFPQALPGGRSVLFTIWGQNRGTAVPPAECRHRVTVDGDVWVHGSGHDTVGDPPPRQQNRYGCGGCGSVQRR